MLLISDKHGLRQYTRFNSEVTGAHFDDKAALWTLDMADGSQVVCQHWVLASGPLHVPSFPDFKGMENFKGKIIHSAQWDHDYDMAGKKVVSIGTAPAPFSMCPTWPKKRAS